MKRLLLICALGMPRADCSVATAEAVIQGPESGSLVPCGSMVKPTSHHGAITGYLDGTHYLKITCASDRPRPAPPASPVESANRPPGFTHHID
jgi:hypothetical protein